MAVRITKDGVQTTFGASWASRIGATWRKAFTQRREQIIGDCLQLQIDVEVYNDMNPRAKPVQLVLNFTDDVAERRAA